MNTYIDLYRTDKPLFAQRIDHGMYMIHHFLGILIPDTITEALQECLLRNLNITPLDLDAAIDAGFNDLAGMFELDQSVIESMRRLIMSVRNGTTWGRRAQQPQQEISIPATPTVLTLECCPLKKSLVSDFFAKAFYVTLTDPKCPVCMDHIVLESFTVLRCGHHHCSSCVIKLDACSLCRQT